MTALLYKDDHNKVAYLEKGKGWEAYEQILDFLNRSHIWYALTHRPPIVFDSLVKQFWATATVRTQEAGHSEIIATIDGNEVVVTKSLIRTQLQLNDETGLYEFTLHDVLDGMREIGTYNFSRFILDGMIGNIWSKRHKFLMYLRFLQMILVVPAGGDGADAAAAGAAAANEVPPPLPPPAVPPTYLSSSTQGPSTVAQDTRVRDPTPVREPTPSPVRVPTTLRETTPEPPRPHSPPLCTSSEEDGPTTSTVGNDSISIEDPLKPIEPWPTSLTTPFNTTTLTRPPSPTRQTSFQEDISKGGGDSVSLPKSNDATPTTAATAAGGAEDSAALTDLSLKLDRCINRVTTLENELRVTKKVLGGAVLKLVSRVNRLEGLLQQRKRRMVLFDSEGEEAATKEKDIDLDALHKLASMSLGGDTTIKAAYTIYKASQDVHASSDVGHDEDVVPNDTTMPFRRTRTKRSTPIPTIGGVSAGSSMDPVGQAVAAPSSSAIPATDKDKAPMVDNSIPADLLTEQERVLKNLHDYQLGEDLAKKLQAEQEAEFVRKQKELEQKAQVESVASPATQGDDVNEDNMNEWLGMFLMRKRRKLDEQSWVKPMNKTQQRDFMRDFVKNQSASVYNQGWTMKQVPAGVPAAPSIDVDVSVFAISTIIADVSAAPTTTTSIAGGPSSSVAKDPTTPTQVPLVTPDLAAVFAHVDTEVHADESRPDDNKTASEQVSAEHTVDESTPSSLCKHRKQLAKKRVTPIVDVADDALIKFDSASESDDDPSPYAPYAGWEMVPTLLGSINAYYGMEEHTKYFTFLREILHMVEKNDLRKLLGVVDNFYQRQEPDTFALILWGIYACCFSRLLMRMHMLSSVIRKSGVFAAVVYILVLSEATLKRMLKHGLEVPKLLVRGDLTMAEQLVSFIKAALLNAQSDV
uniref:Xylulose kinase-1 n=1 Tax=Tanacetum cinerariifolium TaxID=118510 RepID=A0A6L2NMX8_TANCI|nr:xylulose kinase-1 [Tanacetum cinerariifolium]